MVPRRDNPNGSGPVRTCVGCRQRSPQRELLRVVAGTDADGHWFVSPDPTGTAPGRGAHLHPTAECLALAERRRAFARALRHDGERRVALGLDLLRQRVTTAPNPHHPTENWSISS